MFGKKKKKAAAAASSGGGEVALPNLEFKPKIRDSQEAQGVLIACRGIEQYPQAVVLLAKALKNRADQLLLDYSQQGVAIRFRIDGIWENMPPMDRAGGDGILVIYKKMCALNPADRKSRQKGVFNVKYKGEEWIFDFASQGIPTGERVLLKVSPKKPVLTSLDALGMRSKMQESLRGLLNSADSMFLFSGMPGQGLPTTWRVGLESADRFVRDFHSIEDVALNEPEMINITSHHFDGAAGETPMTILKSLLLKQPDVLVFPELPDKDIMKLIVEEVSEESRYAITRIHANTAILALLKMMATYKEQAREIVKVTCGVINQRLIRRLCLECRQPFKPNPQMLAKLGIPAGRVQVLYQPFIPPPPEQRVDANGKPIEIEICKKCNGRGYYGQAAIFELLSLNDEIRKAILKKPEPAAIAAVAKEQGFLSLQEEGVLAVATGLTSLQEVQRVMSPKKKK